MVQNDALFSRQRIASLIRACGFSRPGNFDSQAWHHLTAVHAADYAALIRPTPYDLKRSEMSQHRRMRFTHRLLRRVTRATKVLCFPRTIGLWTAARTMPSIHQSATLIVLVRALWRRCLFNVKKRGRRPHWDGEIWALHGVSAHLRWCVGRTLHLFRPPRAQANFLPNDRDIGR